MIFSDPHAAAEYVLAGHATFTVKSLATGEHYTFRMKRAEDDHENSRPLWFVSVLTLGDVYTYMGVVDGNPLRFRLTKKSFYTMGSPVIRAFEWSFGNVVLRRRIPVNLEVRHEGTCGKCGRALTHPNSIDRGIGPECAKQLACEAA